MVLKVTLLSINNRISKLTSIYRSWWCNSAVLWLIRHYLRAMVMEYAYCAYYCRIRLFHAKFWRISAVDPSRFVKIKDYRFKITN